MVSVSLVPGQALLPHLTLPLRSRVGRVGAMDIRAKYKNTTRNQDSQHRNEPWWRLTLTRVPHARFNVFLQAVHSF